MNFTKIEMHYLKKDLREAQIKLQFPEFLRTQEILPMEWYIIIKSSPKALISQVFALDFESIKLSHPAIGFAADFDFILIFWIRVRRLAKNKLTKPVLDQTLEK